MDDFDLKVIRTLATAAVLFIATAAGCEGHKNYLVTSSDDPVAAACATGSMNACLTVGREK